MSIDNKRRKILVALAYAPFAFYLPKSTNLASTINNIKLLNITSIFSNKKAAMVIGEEYLRSCTRHYSKEELVKELNLEEKAMYSKKLLANYLITQQQEDFKHSRTVTLEGWVLSLTEARLCAVAALS